MRIVFGKYPAHATALVLLLVLLAAGCGSSRKKDDLARGGTLTIYTSLPRHGAEASAGEAVAAGERLALADAHGRVRGRRVRLVELDNSTPSSSGSWDPSAVEANAKRAAADPSTIAYIGELGFGGSAISVPVTNSKGVLQVSPKDGLTSLTQVQPGGPKTSPVRYYPNGRRTFIRLVPTDLQQVRALLEMIRDNRGDALALVHDDRLYGREMAAQAMALAGSEHLSVTTVVEARSDASGYADLARKVASTNPDTVVYLGEGGARAALVLDAFAAALPGARLFASSGVRQSKPPVDVITPVLPAAKYPPSGRRVLARLAEQLGGTAPADGLYGYAAMQLVLDAIAHSGRDPDDRTKVAEAAFDSGPRQSVIGPFSIESSGDVTPSRLASYRLSDGRASFEGLRTAR